MTLVWILSLSAACVNLPEGWEGASPLSDLTQSDCAGDPYTETPQERVELGDDGTSVNYLEAHFRCSQAVEAFGLESEGTLRVLVQPIDMHPRGVARCDCLYNIEIGLDTDATELSLWRRWDEYAGDSEPVSIGSVTLP